MESWVSILKREVRLDELHDINQDQAANKTRKRQKGREEGKKKSIVLCIYTQEILQGDHNVRNMLPVRFHVPGSLVRLFMLMHGIMVLREAQCMKFMQGPWPRPLRAGTCLSPTHCGFVWKEGRPERHLV